LSDDEQITENKHLNRIRKAIGLYCSKGPPMQENFLKRCGRQVSM
jgi:hypothetical protein